MGEEFLIVSNVVIPAITGLFFVGYFVYFTIVFNSKAPSFAFFIAFLLSFGLFLLGRPLQLLMGGHPTQLIVVNIRMLIFCTVSITTITIASNIFSNRHTRRRVGGVFAFGSVLAFIYIVFNTLGTIGSYPVFRLGNLVAYDALTPAMMPPFYGREVTIAVQVVIGFSLLVQSTYQIYRAAADRNVVNTGRVELNRRKVLLFNSGIFLFALTFIVGSLAKQWWLYYFVSMFSALLFGGGVVIDIRELYNNYERLIPIIKEDIIQNVAFSKKSREKLAHLLTCLNKTDRLDTFAILMIRNRDSDTTYQLRTLDSVLSRCKSHLNAAVGLANYVIIPLDDQKIGVVLSLASCEENADVHELTIFETLQQTIYQRDDVTVAIGIGRRYEDLTGLHSSYQEARHALDYASGVSENAIIHVDNIRRDHEKGARYPTNEKMRLLAAIKLGNPADCRNALDEFLQGFSAFVAESNSESLKVRLYELVGAFIDTAISSGGDEERLNPFVKRWLTDIDRISSLEMTSEWLGEIVDTVITFMSKTRKTRSGVIVEKATEMIQARFATPISYKDVAKELYISSSYFLTLFKQETGSTFVEYVTRTRIDRSKELLLSTDRSITEIAFDVGFTNPNYFSSTFKKITGISAKHFRTNIPPQTAES